MVEEIRSQGGEAAWVPGEASSPEDTARLFSEAKRQFGRVDVAFLNAGIYRFSPLGDQPNEDLAAQIDVNVKGVFYGIKEASSHMTAGGSVIVNSSAVAEIGFPGASAYSATKGAVNALVRASAVELGHQGIRVNAVAPGPVWTEGVENMAGSRENADGMMAQLTVFGRLGTPDEIAAGVVFLASDEASFVTGQVLTIDGGVTIK